MDEYIEQVLAEMPEQHSTLHDELFLHERQNIPDEPIPWAVKERLQKPLQPRKYRPTPLPRKKKITKAIEEEFDPIPRSKTRRSVKEYQEDLLDVFTEKEEKTDKLAFT